MERRFAFVPVKLAAKKTRVVLYGLGAIGIRTAEAVLARSDLKVVGAVDIDPDKIGEDVGELIGGDRIGVAVTDDSAALFQAVEAEVVLHTTSSFFPDIYAQMEGITNAGVDTVSSTEELSYPALQHPELAAKLDALARAKGVTVFGTGVNPGFVMDVLPLVMTGVCQEVTSVQVERIVNASTRRGPLQRKIGSGMSKEEFEDLANGGRMGHVGLVESVALIANGLGWEVDTVEEILEPVIAPKQIVTEHVQVAPGQVAGIHQRAWGIKEGEKRITLELQMYLDAEDPHDAVVLEGTPPIHLRIENGTAGDFATVATLINAIPRVVAAPPGLLTAEQLPIPLWRNG